MNQSANRAFRHFAGNRSLRDTPVNKLQTLADGYPYFPVAQFFLAKKLKEDNNDGYLEQSQKAVLYFANPFLFDQLINAELAIENEEAEATGDSFFSDNEEVPLQQTNAPIDIATETNEARGGNNADIIPGTKSSLHDAENADRPAEEPDEHEKMYRSIKAMLDATSDEAAYHADNTEIPIDPYYTIDYFASQGIKLDLEVNPQDKLGQNLKKFTHWLRHMKKLGPEDAKVEIENAVAEADVQKMADSSNSVREVVTEAMASVLEKQGKTAKAVELYNKLSFLNPDKSAYFAAKIEKLKGL